MHVLPTTVPELHAIIQQLMDENTALKARVAELESRLQYANDNPILSDEYLADHGVSSLGG